MGKARYKTGETDSRQHYLPVACLACLCLVITLVLFFLARRSTENSIHVQFEQAASNRIALINREHSRHLMKLEALATFFNASQEVTRQEFQSFVEGFSKGDSDIQALEWAPRIKHAERERIEQQARAEGYADFRITERSPLNELVDAADRPEYFPVYFVEPYQGNEKTLGFDLASEPARRQALEQARDTGEQVVSDRLTLVQKPKNHTGFLVLLPIYRKDQPNASMEDRRKGLTGFVLLATLQGQVLAEALEFSDPVGIDIHFFDAQAPADENYSGYLPSRTWGLSPPAPTMNLEPLLEGLHYQETIRLANRQFRIIATPTPAFIASYRTWTQWFILGGGFTFFAFILFYIFMQVKKVALVQAFASEQARARQALEIEVNERQRAQQQLREANQELESFVYTVSHDLRSPLTPIIGFAELMQETHADQLDDNALESLAIIEEQGTKMLNLMEDLLTLAKVGHLERPSKPVDTDAIIREVTDTLQARATETGTRLLPFPVPSVHVPDSLVAQVFDNLIGNAIRYAGTKSETIEIGGDREGERVRFFVRDHGPGISDKERDRIFEVFYRGATGKGVQGTGIGLATVRKIAKLYGGRAWAEETPGGGSTFWVEINDMEEG